MKCIWRISFVITYVITVFLIYVNCEDSTVVPPDNACFQCICELSSGCNLTVGCNNLRQCGPFQMTSPFWIDAGLPVLELDDAGIPGAFARCANDPNCARRAVESYYKKFARDCNKDGFINCEDYAIIHRYGYVSCATYSLTTEQLRIFNDCLKENRP